MDDHRSGPEPFESEYEELAALRAEKVLLCERIAQLETDIDGLRRSYVEARDERNFLRVHAMPITRYEHDIRPDFGERPSIFLVTLPKSGTVFVSHSLARTLAYDHTATICTRTFPHIVIWPEVMADFVRGNMVAVSHMPPSPFNLEVFTTYARKCVLHVRDPRQVLVSMAYFMKGVWNRAAATGAPGRLQIDTAEHKFYTRSVDGAADISQHIDNMIDSFYADCINWLRAWKAVIEENPAIEILMLDHALLASCTKDYFSRIFDFYNIAQPAALNLMNRTDEAHYRQGGNLEWRTTLDNEQFARLNALLPNDLLWFFGWQR